MCEGVQTDNAGEIVRLGLRITEEKGKRFEKKSDKPTPKDWHHEVQRQGKETDHW